MSDNKEKIGNGKFVAYAYKLYNDSNGELLFETPENAPDVMIYGMTDEIVPGLISAMKGLGTGDKFSVTLPQEAAFGERFEENVVNLEKEIFIIDGELADGVELGAELPMMTQEGFMVRGRVLEITETNVKMDFNHPFAGLTVKYDGEIIEVRDATPEELTPPSHGCGCGCGCGHDHSGCGDSCGDSCGCGGCH